MGAFVDTVKKIILGDAPQSLNLSDDAPSLETASIREAPIKIVTVKDSVLASARELLDRDVEVTIPLGDSGFDRKMQGNIDKVYPVDKWGEVFVKFYDLGNKGTFGLLPLSQVSKIRAL